MPAKIYDVKAATKPELHLKLLKKTEDGEKEIDQAEVPFDPYCYIKAEDVLQEDGTYNPTVMAALNSEDCRLITDDDDLPAGFFKITSKNPWNIGRLKWDYEDHFETWMADVRYENRILIDLDMNLNVPDEEDVVYFDIEVDPRGDGFPEAEDAEAQVLSISCIGGDGETRFFCQDNEKALLEGFLDYVQDNYFVIAGWNSLDFDWKYVQNRAEMLGIWFDDFTLTHVDLYPVYRKANRAELTSYKLDDVAELELDDSKTHEMDSADELEQLWNWFQNDRDKLREYNEHDVRLTKGISDKYKLIKFIYAMTTNSHSRAGQVQYVDQNTNRPELAVGRMCDHKLLEIAKHSYDRELVMPNEGKYSSHDFPGGHVIDPKPGVHRPAVTSDYSGMYPSVMKTFNIGPNTWHDDPIEQAPDEGLLGAQALVKNGVNDVFEDTSEMKARGWFDPPSEEIGLIAAGAEEFDALRKEYKKKKYAATRGTADYKIAKALDGGMKTVANSMFGISAAPHKRYFVPGMSENITEICQCMTGETKAAAERHIDVDYVAYGDTDSIIWVPKYDGDDHEQIVEICKSVSEDLNQHIKAVIQMFCKVDPSEVELEMDEVFESWLIRHKKKRYAGYVIYDEGFCHDLKITGFQCVKSTQSEALSQFQRDLIEALLQDESTNEVIERYKERLFNGALDQEMISYKGLNKAPEDYKGNSLHPRMAVKINEREGEGTVRPGDKVAYVKYDSPTECAVDAYEENIQANFRPSEHYCPECEEIIYGTNHKHALLDAPHFRPKHYSYLWDKKFGKIMDRMGVSLQKQTALGAF